MGGDVRTQLEPFMIIIHVLYWTTVINIIYVYAHDDKFDHDLSFQQIPEAQFSWS